MIFECGQQHDNTYLTNISRQVQLEQYLSPLIPITICFSLQIKNKRIFAATYMP